MIDLLRSARCHIARTAGAGLTLVAVSLLASCQTVVLTPLHYAGLEQAEAAGQRKAEAKPEGILPWPSRLPVKQPPLDERIVQRLSSAKLWQAQGAITQSASPLNALRIREELPDRHRKAFDESLAELKTQLEPEPPTKETEIRALIAEGPGAFIFVKGTSDPDNPAGPLAGRASLLFQHLSARLPKTLTDELVFEDEQGAATKVAMKVSTSRVERTWFAYYDPFPPRDERGFLDGDRKAEVRGLVVILPGMFGTPPDQIGTLTRRLRNEGFAVLRMLAHPSLFTEHVSFAVPMQGPLDAAAKDIAAELTGRTTEVSYALESALAHVMTQRPELIDKKLGLVGMSGGAMVAPTIVARNPKLFERVVLIGGGADYLQILLESNYREWIDAVEVLFFEGTPATGAPLPDGTKPAIEPVRPDEPPKPGAGDFRLVSKGPAADARRAELLTAYRKHAPLDSANLATALAGTKVLMVQGTTDRAVPRATGDLLWEKAGKPERIMVAGGHEWLFFTLNRHLPRMTEFLAQGLDPGGKPRADNQREVDAPAENKPAPTTLPSLPSPASR